MEESEMIDAGPNALDPDVAGIMSDLGIDTGESTEAVEQTTEVDSEKELATGTEQVLNELNDDQDLEDILSEVESEQTEETEKEVSEEFELKRGDEVINVGRDQVIDLAQKGHDYTQKTQELSEERKSFETEIEEAKEYLLQKDKEYNDLITSNKAVINNDQMWGAAIDRMKADGRTDLIEDMQFYFQAQEREFNNPVVQQMQNQLSNLEGQIQDQNQSTLNKELELSDQKHLNEFDNEWKELNPVIKELEKLGLKISEEDVMDVWANNEKLKWNVKKSLSAAYGEQITSLKVSKAKVQRVQNSVRKGPPSLKTGVGTNSSGSSSGDKGAIPDTMSTAHTAYAMAREMGIEL